MSSSIKPKTIQVDLFVAHDNEQDLWIGFERIDGKYKYLDSMDSVEFFIGDLFFGETRYDSVTIVRGDVSKHSGLQQAYLAAQK